MMLGNAGVKIVIIAEDIVKNSAPQQRSRNESISKHQGAFFRLASALDSVLVQEEVKTCFVINDARIVQREPGKRIKKTVAMPEISNIIS